jgi:site-specific DNA-cytosine methylase
MQKQIQQSKLLCANGDWSKLQKCSIKECPPTWVAPLSMILPGALNLARIGPIDLVISRWPCQGLSQVGMGQGLSNLRSSLF